MGRLRVRFTSPQPVTEVLSADALVSEVVIETDHVALLRDNGMQLSVSPEVLAWMRPDDPEPQQADTTGMVRERPPNEGAPWTDEEVAALRAAWESGVRRTRELAERHGRSTGAIRSRLRALGLTSGA